MALYLRCPVDLLAEAIGFRLWLWLDLPAHVRSNAAARVSYWIASHVGGTAQPHAAGTRRARRPDRGPRLSTAARCVPAPPFGSLDGHRRLRGRPLACGLWPWSPPKQATWNIGAPRAPHRARRPAGHRGARGHSWRSAHLAGWLADQVHAEELVHQPSLLSCRIRFRPVQ